MKKKLFIHQIFTRSYRKSSKFNMQVTTELQEIIIGLMLGDLHAEKRNVNSNTRLQFKQSNKNNDYIQHLFSIFRPFCGSPPKVTTSFDNRTNKKKFYSSIKF
jgi:hypothetical protein